MDTCAQSQAVKSFTTSATHMLKSNRLCSFSQMGRGIHTGRRWQKQISSHLLLHPQISPYYSLREGVHFHDQYINLDGRYIYADHLTLSLKALKQPHSLPSTRKVEAVMVLYSLHHSEHGCTLPRSRSKGTPPPRVNRIWNRVAFFSLLSTTLSQKVCF